MQWSIKSAMISMESNSVRCFRSTGKELSEKMSAAIDRAFLIMELCKGNTERFASVVLYILHCKNLDIEANCDNLKCLELCSELVGEGSSLMFKKNKIF